MRRAPSSTVRDQRVSVTTGTSSAPFGFTSGGSTPDGTLSMLDWILSWTLTIDAPRSSPTKNCAVTIPCPRWVAE